MNNLRLSMVTKVTIKPTEQKEFVSDITNETIRYQTKDIVIEMVNGVTTTELELHLLSSPDHTIKTEEIPDESEFEIEELFEGIGEDVL